MQLATAVVVMACVAPVQYSWTLFTTSLSKEHGWSLAAVQLAFTFFVVLQTAVQPAGGLLMDRGKHALVYGVAGLLIVVGWGGLGMANLLALVYASYALAGAGVGLAYAGAIGTAIRWFPERRGLALGMVAAGYGAGAAPFIPLIQWLIEDKGYPKAFAITAFVTGVVVAVAGLLLRHPAQSRCSRVASPVLRAAAGEGAGLHPWELLKVGQFWFAFLGFFFMATGLLILTANTTPLALDLGLSRSVAVIAVTLQQVMNGTSRVAWGWVSDHVGRRLTMVLAFSLNGAFLCLIPLLGGSAFAFVALTSLSLFTAGEIFALFPALTADLFGIRHAAANQGMLYTAKGLAALLGGSFAAWLATSRSWQLVFALAGTLAFISAGMMLELRPRSTTSHPIDDEVTMA